MARGATADPFVGDPGTTKTPFAAQATKAKSLGAFMGDGLQNLADYEGRELQVFGIDGPHEGRFGDFMVVTAADPDDAATAIQIRAGGVAVVDALKRAKDSLAPGDYPIAATFVKREFSSGRTGWVVE